MYSWTDSDTGQEALAWKADADTVVWLFYRGLKDDEARKMAATISVGTQK